MAAARRHTLEALNFRRPLGKHATPPLELLRPALTQLALLEPAVDPGRAWIAALPANALPAPLAGMSFIVYAASQPQAERCLQTVIEAMSAGGPRVIVSNIIWRLAPPEHQPFGSVPAGGAAVAGRGRGITLPGISASRLVADAPQPDTIHR